MARLRGHRESRIVHIKAGRERIIIGCEEGYLDLLTLVAAQCGSDIKGKLRPTGSIPITPGLHSRNRCASARPQADVEVIIGRATGFIGADVQPIAQNHFGGAAG